MAAHGSLCEILSGEIYGMASYVKSLVMRYGMASSYVKSLVMRYGMAPICEIRSGEMVPNIQGWLTSRSSTVLVY